MYCTTTTATTTTYCSNYERVTFTGRGAKKEINALCDDCGCLVVAIGLFARFDRQERALAVPGKRRERRGDERRGEGEIGFLCGRLLGPLFLLLVDLT